jgi:hypothetical protein
MSSQARTREEERRFNVRTLVFASIGAAVAATVTSQFWIAGTPIAAAMTPVIVALVSEMLHRPTEKIAQKLTSETDALPESAGAAPPPDEPEPPARDFTLYTSQKQSRDLPWGKILATGAIAFVIGVGILTLPELISGQSLGKGDGRTSILGNNRDRDNGDEEEAPEEQETVTETVPAEPAPQTTPQTAPSTTPAPQQQTTPTTPTTPKAPAP